ncbi:hypothetical protein EEL32_22110 [Brevibacillus laterosporus]|nr:hypothetical protein [Brevibacillus laterosporus]RAP27493.1 hypothetical protein C2W64_00992 [Brevibacillus laterosporus]TPG78164.1 hypothetical protein EEL32_22110 [Brevibacillus laterosporus]
MKWKIIVPIAILIIVAIGFFIFNQQRTAVYKNPETVVKQFQQAVEQNQLDIFVQVTTVPTGVKATLTDKNAAGIIASLSKHTETWKTYVNSLTEQAASYQANPSYIPEALEDAAAANSLLVLKKVGNVYKVQVRPVYMQLIGPKGTKLVTGEQGVEITPETQSAQPKQKKSEEVTSEQDNKDTFKVGPFFPGEHFMNGSLPTMLGTVSTEIKFDVSYGRSQQVIVNFPVRDVKVYTNVNKAKLFHNGQALPVTFEKSFTGYDALITNAPKKALEFTIKATTPLGEVSNTGTLGEQDTFIDLPIQISEAGSVEDEISAFFKAYNKAWLQYAKTKTSVDPLVPYLSANGDEKKSYDREVEQFKITPNVLQQVFVGDLLHLEIDFGALEMVDDTHLKILVREVYQDKWKNLSTKQISDHGQDEQCWEYELHKAGDKWQLASTRAESLSRFGLNRDQVKILK